MAGTGYLCYPVAFYFLASVKFILYGTKEDSFFESERWNLMQIIRDVSSVVIVIFYLELTGTFIPKLIWNTKDIPVIADFFVKKMSIIFILCCHFNSQNFIPSIVFCCSK